MYNRIKYVARQKLLKNENISNGGDLINIRKLVDYISTQQLYNSHKNVAPEEQQKIKLSNLQQEKKIIKYI